ncbi:MAG: SDR family oxidoreductase [Negativicutes bacterium]|nr:SDR family oxidoreductase [Negativicutes bacterium]
MNHDFSLAGQLAVVTGGSRGIGQGIAVALARAGADIVSLQRGTECEETTRLVGEQGRKCFGVACNLAVLSDAEPLVEEIESNYGPVGILINNAGIQRRHKAEEFPLGDWDLVLQVHLRASFLLCQAFGKRMLARGGGKIINMASLLSFSGGYTVPAYAAAKGGIAQLTKALANEWAGRGVNVNAIAPGYIDTEMNTALIGDPVRNPQIMARIPAGRWGKPADLGGPAVFLASKAADYVHGHILYVDGAWMAR